MEAVTDPETRQSSSPAGLAFFVPPGLLALLLLPTSPRAGILLLLWVIAAAVSLFFLDPGVVFALGVAGAVFSGFGPLIGLPISPDRPLTTLGLAALLAGAPLAVRRTRRLRWHAVHTWMLITVVAVIILGTVTDSFSVDGAIFALLDRLGVVPFIAFVFAPLFFGTERQRASLSAVVVAVGWYLGITAVLEGFGLRRLTWPGYINDPSLGLHFERARGPFLESTGMGLALLGCMIVAIVAAQTWLHRSTRMIAAAAVPVLLLGSVFTLTRAVWLAAAVSLSLGIISHARSRRWFLPIAATALISVFLALAVVPGLSEQVTERRTERVAVWDRLNSNEAAIVAFRENPIVGIGWGLFAKRSDPYLWQADNIPLTGHRIEVHNVLLSRLAEIGLAGTIPWLVTVTLGIALPIVRRPPPELEAWRRGLLMYAAAWAVMGAFGPMSTAFPNLLLWVIAGVVSAPHTSEPLDDVELRSELAASALPPGTGLALPGTIRLSALSQSARDRVRS